MKKILHAIIVCLTSFQAFAQTTVTIRPHFTGIECFIGRADSTHGSWAGSPNQYMSSSPNSNPVIIAYMAWTSSGCPFVARTLIRFADLTNPTYIPAGSTITSATLYLYGIPSTPTGDYGNSTWPGSPYTMYGTNRGKISALSSTFNPTTTTWNTRPSVASVTPVAIPPSTAHFGTSDTINVTSLVTYLFANGNHGFEIKIDTESIYREHLYGSSRYSDSSRHPALKVTFIAPSAISSVNDAEPRVTLYPNPAKSELNAEVIINNSASMSIGVYNIVGQKVFTSKQNFTTGVNTVQIPLDALSSGVYFVELSNESTIIKQKFIKE